MRLGSHCPRVLFIVIGVVGGVLSGITFLVVAAITIVIIVRKRRLQLGLKGIVLVMLVKFFVSGTYINFLADLVPKPPLPCCLQVNIQ